MSGLGKKVGTLVLPMLMVGTVAGNVAAQEARNAPRADSRAVLEFAISPQPLSSALIAYSRAAGVQVITDASKLGSAQSPGVSGRFTREQGLAKLLASTGFEFVFEGADTVVVHRRKAAVEAAPTAGTPAKREWVAIGGEASELDTIRVYATGFSATRAQTSLRDIAQSVSVISRKTMDQQNAADLTDALSRATGIIVHPVDTTDQRYFSRGFSIDTYHIDGGAPLTIANDIGGQVAVGAPGLAQYDRVEVLRGSDALFGGSGNPGASINLVRKSPKATFGSNVSMRYGSWDNARIEGDLTGAFNPSGSLRGLVGFSHQDNRYFYDTSKNKQQDVYAAIEGDIGSRTTLTVGGSLEHSNQIPSSGLPRHVDGSDPGLPRSTSFTVPWEYYRINKKELYAKLEHAFNDQWRIRLNLTDQEQTTANRDLFLTDPIDHVSGRRRMTGLVQTTGDSPDLTRQKGGDISLNGSFGSERRRHDFIVGFDAQRLENRKQNRSHGYTGVPADSRDFNPDAYPVPPVDGHFGPNGMGEFDSHVRTAQYGLYTSLRLQLADSLHATVGGRYSQYRQYPQWGRLLIAPGQVLFEGVAPGYKDPWHFAPYAGLTWALGDNYSIYASYADMFRTARGNVDRDGNRLPAISGVTLETGVKGEWFGGALNGSLALFDIKQDGHAFDATVPPNRYQEPGCCFLMSTRTSRGIDAELSGRITPYWDLTVGYTYNRNRNEVPGARSTSSTSPHLLKVWTDYRFSGAWQGLSIGGGVLAQSGGEQTGQECLRPLDAPYFYFCRGEEYVPYRIKQGAYANVTLRVAWQIQPKWSVALNVDNLFDEVYYARIASPALGNWYGAPRSFMLTLQGGF